MVLPRLKAVSLKRQGLALGVWGEAGIGNSEPERYKSHRSDLGQIPCARLNPKVNPNTSAKLPFLLQESNQQGFNLELLQSHLWRQIEKGEVYDHTKTNHWVRVSGSASCL
jgi:hypothetical protein